MTTEISEVQLARRKILEIIIREETGLEYDFEWIETADPKIIILCILHPNSWASADYKVVFRFINKDEPSLMIETSDLRDPGRINSSSSCLTGDDVYDPKYVYSCISSILNPSRDMYGG